MAGGAACKTDTRHFIWMPKKDRRPKARSSGDKWFVYIVRCTDGSLYTGITKDVKRRCQQHNAGTASRYTRSRRPVKIDYQEVHLDYFIDVKDFPKCWHDLDITVEVEAKAKELAVLKLKTDLERRRKPKKVRNKS